MNKEIRNTICAGIASALAVGILCGALYRFTPMYWEQTHISVMVVCEGDKSTHYTANFVQAACRMQEENEAVGTMAAMYNVSYDHAEEIITQLASEGADLIFTNSYGYGEIVRRIAADYPDTQFCAATCDNADPSVPNYHTFMGKICEGRYVCGVAAGAKLNQLIAEGSITPEQAVLGYVAAYPNPEVISGYTAFLLGVRSQCPTAVMRVRYIDTWSNYALERQAAEELIADGCIILSHHTNTAASAIACENADMPYPVYHVSYNQDMINLAPTAELIGTCMNWKPYMEAAANAVHQGKNIELQLNGSVFGNDAAGGLAEDWVHVFDINTAAAAPGTEALLKETLAGLQHGKIHIFQGNYIGVDPEHPEDICDLRQGYEENAASSAPTFHYVLQDVITIVE